VDWSFKVINAVFSSLKWLYSLCLDRTRIVVLFPRAANWSWDSVPVSNAGNDTGLFMFSITTRSKKSVEVVRVEVHYAAPLQLHDPDSRGFFVGSGTLDQDLPFSMYWAGSAVIRRDVQQAFALTAQFPNRTQDQHIRISIYARRQHTIIGGFVTQGRVHASTKEYRTRLISQPLIGFRIPPLCSLTTPQPFLIERGGTVSTEPGKSGSILVHERDSNGTVSSTPIELPRA